jgi:hypothetical protein
LKNIFADFIQFLKNFGGGGKTFYFFVFQIISKIRRKFPLDYLFYFAPPPFRILVLKKVLNIDLILVNIR